MHALKTDQGTWIWQYIGNQECYPKASEYLYKHMTVCSDWSDQHCNSATVIHGKIIQRSV